MDEILNEVLNEATLLEVDKLIPETMEFPCDEVTTERIKAMVNKKIKQADSAKKHKKPWRKYGVWIAGLALVFSSSLVYWNYQLQSDINVEVAENPRLKEDSRESSDVARIGINYKGKLYYQSGFVDNTPENYLKLVGESIGYPDKTNSKPRDKYDFEYNDSLPSKANQIFKVKGYDESFRICIPEVYKGVATISFFENLDYQTLTTNVSNGSNLYSDRLALLGNIVKVKYQAHITWKKKTENLNPSPVNYKDLSIEEVEEFIKALNKSKYIGFYPEGKSQRLSDSTQCHLFLEMKDGTTVELLLIDGGYVRYEGTNGHIVAQLPFNYLDGDNAESFKELFLKITQ